MKLYSLLLAVTFLPTVLLFSQTAATPADKEAAYTRTIQSRAEKIVAALSISDPAKQHRVSAIIAGQYRNLNHIHTSRDEAIKAAKAEKGDQASTDAQIKSLEDKATAGLDKLHAQFIAELATELTPQQVMQVKDGLTYGVVPITYKGYVDMIPSLKKEEKDQIMAWLVEAREHAMDAESSEKKHGWFGKYKGKINNYLSAAGYDIRKEREGWEKRIAAAKAASGNQ